MEQNRTLTLGSLFDGSGGFPLGGLISGITPVWASEIEPFPIRVTTKRMPFMKHYGDISKMDGGKIEPVDIITFGSPCQDMSVAGRRDGLGGSRSSLFYEAVRFIKEMRCATDGRYPRYCVWENVPGAFSSNKGEDFRCVLEAVCSVKDTDPIIPEPPKGRWDSAGSILGDGYSVAWRTLDAQFWGVPQRRKRIYLVADFTGGGAGKILFESEGLSGYTPQGFRSWQGTAGSAESGIGASGIDGYNGDVTGDVSATLGVNCGMSTGRNGVVLNDQGGNRMDITDDVTCTLRAEAHHPPCVMDAAGFCTEHSAKARSIGYEKETAPTLRAGTVPAAVALENHPTDSRVKISEDGKVQTLTSRIGTGGNNVPLLMKIRSGCEGGGKGALIQTDKSATLATNNDQTLFEPCAWDGSQVSPTLTKQNAGGSQRMPDKDNFNCVLQPFGICAKDSNSMKSDNPHSGIYEAETARTLDTGGGNPSCNQGGIAIVAFTQNQRDEVRNLGEHSAAVCANAGTKQQTFVLQGSMIGRKDGNGPQGNGINEDVSFTLNTADRHAVYAMTTGSYMQTTENQSPTLMARDYKDPAAVAYGIGRDAMNQGKNAQFTPSVSEEVQPTLVAKGPGAVAETSPEYTVRRLTPTECARLQGFPDWWCSDLGTENPSYGDIDFWTEVFETHRTVTGTSTKQKTQAQIIKWLKNPYSDSAEYKMWGNGVALPCVCFVLSGIVWAAQNCDK
jgi:DNA (cytosine-5)-methyltransferase 1|nr:MAG TPA: Cytosine specific methyltransferase [Caudoviricetes sp.]